MQVIRQAYDKLDKNRDGRVTLEDLASLYDASETPAVKSGKATPEEVFRAFINNWDTQKKDGIVTAEEFADYYKVIYLMSEGCFCADRKG